MQELSIKERALKYGTEVLLPVEKLQLITAIEKGHLAKYRTLIDVRRGIMELQVTPLQQIRLKALFDLIEHYSEESYKGRKLTSQKDTYDLMRPKLAHLEIESFYTILLDTKLKVIDIMEISRGSLTGSIVHPREVFKPAIQKSAYAIICLHNHPSGDSTPSKEDIAVTARLKEVGQLIGISILDHMIIGRDEFTSLKEKGYL